jgi:hypothetical protein
MIYHAGISERAGRIEIQGGPLWKRKQGEGVFPVTEQTAKGE